MLLWMLIAASGAAWLALLVLLLHLQRRLRALQARTCLAAALPQGTSRPLITVEILNPFELAANRVAIAALGARLAPRMIERIVYQTTRDILRTEIAKHGVDARIRICHVD